MTAAPVPLNLIVVICHDLGAHLGCYGAPGVRSTHIDRFAAANIRFANSFCTAPQCSPSRAALWTGRYPHANGVVGLTHWDFANDLHPGEVHFAQHLTAAGYDTHLFGVQHESPNPARCGYTHIHPGKPCGELADDFAVFLAARPASSDPLYAQIGFFEPHRPFPHSDVPAQSPAQVTLPPYLPDLPEVRADYTDLEASITSADHAFGKILAAVDTSPLASSTIVLFTADHGIAYPHSKMTLYDPGIQVGLALRLPDGPQEVVYEELVSNVDVLPTLCDLLSLPHPPNVQGRSFANLMQGKPYLPHDAVFAEKTYHTYYDPMRCIRTARWKLIANFEFTPWQEMSPDFDINTKTYVEIAKALQVPYDQMYHPPYELFDLKTDPLEQHNLASQPEYTAVRNDLIRRLRAWMIDTGDPLLDGPIPQAAYLQRMAAFKSL